MHRMLVAEPTILPILHSLGMQALVLRGIVVSTLTLTTCQYYSISGHLYISSLIRFGDDAGADCTATFTNRETKLFLHRYRHDQFHRSIVILSPGMTISTPSGKMGYPRHVGRAEIKLRTITREERRVTTTLFLRQDIYLGLELRVRSDRTRLRQYHAALKVFLVHTTKQQTYVVTSFTVIQKLAEHLDTRNHRLARLTNTDNLDLFTLLDNTALNTTGAYRATTRNRKYILNRHQERLVLLTLRLRNIIVQSMQSTHQST